MPKTSATPAAQLADRVLRAAEKAQSEEDLKIAVERALEKALTELGIQSAPEYEKTILSGSADAIYGHVVIEYEKPGKLAKEAGRTETVGQLTRYLLGQTAKQGAKQPEALAKMIGVSLDGRQILFVRYTATERGREFSLPGLPGGQITLFEEKGVAGRFQILGPYPVNEDSIGVFLLYLRSLARKPLTPEALARDFGPSGEVASALVGALHASLKQNIDNPHIATFFNEWERLFGIVYGEELGKAEADAQELAKLYRVPGKPQLKPLLFTVHTYYALLMKFLAIELISLQGGMLVTSFASDLHALTEAELKARLTDLEDGGLFHKFGIVNFLEGDFFRWYLNAWSKDLAAALRQFAQTLVQFEPATSTLEPESTRDLLKKLYQYLIPKSLRHDLGEYYTPDWLAERLLNQLGYDGDPQARLIDPSCGSGTFLILALKRLRARGAEKLLTGKQIAEAALKNIVGFDLNPLAVIAARTNYLLALGDLIRHVRPVEIPVYMCDSILTPSESSGQLELFSTGYTIHTAAGDFKIPSETVKAREIEKLAALLEDAVKNGYSAKDFLTRARKDLTLAEQSTEPLLKQLFEKMAELHQSKRDGIWARLIKNAFAPIFVGQFDFVAGNPPWINWESLSQEYREATAPLWKRYEMQAKSGGKQFELGKVKRDISMLFAYVCIDGYLKANGKLGFVITQTIFKTASGEVFRNFQLDAQTPIGVQAVDDMVELQPFEGASNWTSVFVCQKGRETKYPVPYTVWRKVKGRSFPIDSALEEVNRATKRLNYVAVPVDATDRTSHWITARPKALKAVQNVLGKSSYEARAGLVTWADGVYWVHVAEKRPDGLLQISNLHDEGKRKLEKVQAAVEPDLLYPFARWTDLGRYVATPSCYILLPHTKEGGWKPIDESEMRAQYPKSYAYLSQFKEVLLSRSGYKQLRPGEAFYILSNTGPWLYAPFKVAWKSMGTRMQATVLETVNDPLVGMRPIMHKNTVVFIATENRDEAHYLCGILNSSMTDFIARSYSVGKSFGSPHLLQQVGIPSFDPASALHKRLAVLSQKAHGLAAAGDAEALAKVEREIDAAAAELWGINPAELEEIRGSLEELG